MSYAKARTIDVEEIPVIDIAPLFGEDSNGLRLVAEAMRDAAEGIGFFYIRNHGISSQLIDDAQTVAHKFFAHPINDKLRLAPRQHHRGFLQIGQAKMHQKARPDLKESFIWGLDVADDDPDYLSGSRMISPNQWPEFVPEMRPVLNAYFAAANECGRLLLRAFAVALDQAPDHFTAHFDKPVSRGSLVYYPAQPESAGERQFGVSPHTDYGVITILHQDLVGGLQVSNRRGEWLTAHPIEGTLVINVGDLLARWTNNRFQSTPHRVINSSGRERLAMAVFVDPNDETPIVPVVRDGEKPKYEATQCGAYILGRYDKSFSYRQQG
ncbi:MAG: 2-oxoglutarate and iron-dependent oxygenase domain-containing protein [Burkholderiaceae bacterium]